MAKPRLKESLGTNLLISFLIRYPQLSSLRYNRQTGTLAFTFLLNEAVEPSKQSNFIVSTSHYFAACRELDPRFSPLGEIAHTSMEEVTVLVYEQPVAHLKIEGIRLFIELVSDFYGEAVSREAAALQEEELDLHEEIIMQILEQKEAWCDEKLIVAYRDGGKVFVYNK